MKKPELLTLLKTNQSDVARMLGITRGAVCLWGDEKPIPNESYLRLRYEIAPHLPWPDKGVPNANA